MRTIILSSALRIATIGAGLAVGTLWGAEEPSGPAATAIMPVADTQIELLSAKIDVEWASPSRVTAVFQMANGQPPTETLFSFPTFVGGADNPDWENPYEVTIDGKLLTAVTSMLTGQGETGIVTPSWNIYRHVFRRGRTDVLTKSLVPVMRFADGTPREVFRISLEGAARWHGPIGTAEIAVHFPGAVAAAQFLSITPAGYTIAGDTLKWTFKDFDPKGKEFDIAIARKAEPPRL